MFLRGNHGSLKAGLPCNLLVSLGGSYESWNAGVCNSNCKAVLLLFCHVLHELCNTSSENLLSKSPVTPSQRHWERNLKVPRQPGSLGLPWNLQVSLPVSLRGSYGRLEVDFQNSSNMVLAMWEDLSINNKESSGKICLRVLVHFHHNTVFEMPGEKPAGSRAARAGGGWSGGGAAQEPAGLSSGVSKTE
jgi:hypothetical protein